jgi:general secretion pathway protein C
MPTTVKRYLWLLPAVMTVLVAWFLAAAAGELLLSSVGGKVDLSQAPPGNIDQDAGLAGGFASADKPLRLDDLLAGNLFDLPPEEPDAGAEETDAEPLDAAPEPPPESAQDLIPPCAMNLKVLALVAGDEPHPERGFATLEQDGRQQEYRIGYQLGDRTLSRITWNRVYLEQAGTGNECFVDIRYPDLARAGNAPPPVPTEPTKPTEPPPPPPPGNEPQSREDRFAAAVDSSIEVVSDTERNVQRSLINTILDNQDIAMRQARVMPHEENGEVVGFKVYGIRRDSLFGKLGLENGDLIRSVNGIPMTGADKALQAYGRLRMADQIAVTVTRRGQELSLSFAIR